MTTRFVIDERSIDLNGLAPGEALNIIEDLFDCIEDALDDGHETCFDEELFHLAIVGQWTFWNLTAADSPIPLPPEVCERAAALFGRMPRWYEADTNCPPTFDVSVDGGPVENSPSVAWAAQKALTPGGLGSVGCISARGRRRAGAVSVDMSSVRTPVCFATNALELQEFFRWLIVQYATTDDDIAALATAAFKGLDFVDGCFSGIKDMSKPCRQLVPEIVRHLSAFSDHGARIFSGPWIRVPAEFGQYGVEISDENGKTKDNGVAKRERTIIFKGEKLIFWWHSKFERHQDRIHIYPDKVAEGGKVIVGIFCNHLTV